MLDVELATGEVVHGTQGTDLNFLLPEMMGEGNGLANGGMRRMQVQVASATTLELPSNREGRRFEEGGKPVVTAFLSLAVDRVSGENASKGMLTIAHLVHKRDSPHNGILRHDGRDVGMELGWRALLSTT
eukprot:15467411-Alexandrium_andersonii.AAC.1